jgi:hypothetical protein
LNWADFSQPVNELYQTAVHPALSPIFAILNDGSKRRIILADLVSGIWHWLGWGVTSGERFGLAHFSKGLWFFDDFSKLT